MSRPLSLSSRAEALQPSLTLAISARAKALQQEGRDICSLSAGEPDFDTPDFIVEASVEALRNGVTRYVPLPEIPICGADRQQDHQRERNPTSAAEVRSPMAEAGHLQPLSVLLNPGDEVRFLRRSGSVNEMALPGARPVAVPSSADDGFRLDLHALEAAITPASRVLVINSPKSHRPGAQSR